MVFVWVLCVPTFVVGQEKMYRLELGVQAGAGYYMGELAPHAFMNVSEVYGAQIRCKIDQRWALQVKGQRQRVVNTIKVGNDWGLREGKYVNPVWHFDATGEFNFFRLGINPYDIHQRALTPFVFVGIGFAAHNVYANDTISYPILETKTGSRVDYALYLPVGVGLKWKFAERWQLQLAWQHNIYVLNGDGLEGVVNNAQPNLLNNSYELNGSNVMNNDVTSTITLGIVFEFAADHKICPFCEY
jgi:hypothetical protein